MLHFLLAFFSYCLATVCVVSFDEANYFSSTNIKKEFFFFFFSVSFTSWNRISGVCAHAWVVNYFTHIHTYYDSGKTRKKRKLLVLIYSSLREKEEEEEEEDVIWRECGTRRLNANSWLFLSDILKEILLLLLLLIFPSVFFFLFYSTKHQLVREQKE